jgi:ribosomal protein L29
MLALGLSAPFSSAPLPHSSLKTASPSLVSSFGSMRLGTNSSSAAPSGSRGSLVAVRMAKRENEMAEIRSKSTEELQEEVVDLKGEILMQKLLWSARKDYDQGAFRRMRKQVLFKLHFSSSVPLWLRFEVFDVQQYEIFQVQRKKRSVLVLCCLCTLIARSKISNSIFLFQFV